MELSPEQLLGQIPELMDNSLGMPLHPAILTPLTRLQQRAAQAGFDLRVVSGYRGFDRQLAIWNAKAGGQRALLDSDGRALDFASLSPGQLIHAILRWSALPGGSRHHWGTDIDVYDAAAVDADYTVQLTPQEVNAGGPFAPMHDWLDDQFQRDDGEGFFRPYDVDRGGVAPERWHLSFAPLAAHMQSALTLPVLARGLAGADVALKDVVLAQLPDLYRRYVAVPVSAYPERFRSLLVTQEEG